MISTISTLCTGDAARRARARSPGGDPAARSSWRPPGPGAGAGAGGAQAAARPPGDPARRVLTPDMMAALIVTS